MKIAVLSDTHWQFCSPQPRVLTLLAEQKPDLILHAGDWTDLCLLPELQKIASVEAVAGNCDRSETTSKLGEAKVVQADGVSIGLTHGHLFPHLPTPQSALRTFADKAVQAVVFGHSHVPLCEWHEDVLLFNPGSAVRPLGEIKKPSYGLLTIEEGKIQGEIVYFDK
jgi:phosphoesterase, MJ0936 family